MADIERLRMLTQAGDVKAAASLCVEARRARNRADWLLGVAAFGALDAIVQGLSPLNWWEAEPLVVAFLEAMMAGDQVPSPGRVQLLWDGEEMRCVIRPHLASALRSAIEDARYLAPELWGSHDGEMRPMHTFTMTEAASVFSAGCIIYELLIPPDLVASKSGEHLNSN